jgi:two-component system response regulator (stage 0 sporulation protein F)
MSVQKKVLVVDDQEGIRMLLDETCSLLGYNAVTVPSGLEAIKLQELNEFRAALIDMKMPGINGIETMNKLQSLYPEMKVALMTGYGEICHAEETVDLEYCNIIRKPFDLDEIKDFLERVFE